MGEGLGGNDRQAGQTPGYSRTRNLPPRPEKASLAHRPACLNDPYKRWVQRHRIRELGPVIITVGRSDWLTEGQETKPYH